MAIENGVQNAELGYILDPAFQIENLNGKPVVGGWICVYEAGTDNKYISYNDFEGSQNPFKIPLKADGRAVILGDPSIAYDVYVYDGYGNQIFSRLNVQCNVPGTINLSGADTRIRNTDGTLDISLQTMSGNVREYTLNTRNKLLDVKSPLYFVENSPSATVIGIIGSESGYVSQEYVDSVVSGKLDTSAFSAVSANFLTDKFEYDDNNNITAYNHSAFACGGANYEAGDHIAITDNVISVTGLPNSADIENAITSAVEEVENKFEYNVNNYITAYNNSAFAGKEYNAGDYVRIENDTISVTGLQPTGDYATRDELTSKLDTTAFSNVSGSFLTAHQDLGNYATKSFVASAVSGKQDKLTAGYGVAITDNVISVTSQGGGGIEQVRHDNTLTGNGNDIPLGIAGVEDFVKQDDLDDYATTADLVNKLDTTAFSNVSGTFLTAHQSLDGYATEDWVNNQGYLTAHQSLEGYATTALVSSVSSELYSAISEISGDYELVAGSGVELVDDPNAKTTTINVTAQGTPVTAIEQMIESATSGLQPSGDYATTAQVAEKLDTTAFSNVSGDFLTAHQDISNLMPKSESANFYPMTGNPSGFLTAHQDLSNYATTADLTGKLNTTAFSTVSSNFLTAHQDLSDYATTASVAEKLDTTAFSTVSGDFLTAVDLTPYQTTAGMTAYQPVGEYASASELVNYQPVSAMTAYQEAGDYYSASNPSGFITAVPDTYLQNTDLTIVDNKITEISGVPISAGSGGGGELPAIVSAATDYVSATSGDINSTINNVSANSGVWGGSALPISAGPGIKLEMIDNTLVFSNDETVLWDSNGTPVTMDSTKTTGVTLSENPFNYDRIRLYWIPWNYENIATSQNIDISVTEGRVTSSMNRIGDVTQWTADDNTTFTFVLNCMFDMSHFYAKHVKYYSIGDWHTNSDMTHSMLYKIVGINRIAGGN